MRQDVQQTFVTIGSGPRVDIDGWHFVAVWGRARRILVATRYISADPWNPPVDDVYPLRFLARRENCLHPWEYLLLGCGYRPGRVVARQVLP